jgi:uncharacterized protein (TIRG00374 family)
MALLSPRWSYAIRLLLSISLFYLALKLVDWPRASQMLISIDLAWLGFHLLLLASERLIFTWKWHGLLKARGVDVPALNLLTISLVGKFWGMFLPSSVGVDVVRGYYLYRFTGRGAEAASSVLVDKILALWALLLIGSIGLVFYGRIFSGTEVGIYIFTILAVTGLILFLIARQNFANWLSKSLPRVFGEKFGEGIDKAYASFRAYGDHPAALFKCFVLSLLIQFLRVLIAWTMANALGIDIPFVYYFLFIPIAMILIMLPVSIGGFGMREGVLVGLFALAGFSTTDAFALGFAISITDMISSLIGGVIYLFMRVPKEITAEFATTTKISTDTK